MSISIPKGSHSLVAILPGTILRHSRTCVLSRASLRRLVQFRLTNSYDRSIYTVATCPSPPRPCCGRRVLLHSKSLRPLSRTHEEERVSGAGRTALKAGQPSALDKFTSRIESAQTRELPLSFCGWLSLCQVNILCMRRHGAEDVSSPGDPSAEDAAAHTEKDWGFAVLGCDAPWES